MSSKGLHQSSARVLIMGSTLRLSPSGRSIGPTHGWSKVVLCKNVWRICRIMVLPDENERYRCVPTCPSAGMDQSMARWLRVVRTRTITRPDCLHKLRTVDREEYWRCAVPWNSTHSQSYSHIIDAGVSMSSGHGVKLLALSAVG